MIDYDRVNLGGTAPYYVSFDSREVGKLQAQTMIDCLDAQGVDNPNIIMMNGGTDVDNNAVLFQKGAHEVLDPLVDQGKATITQEATVKGWLIENAAPTFQQALTAAGGTVDGVVAANDDIANAVIGVLKNSGLNGHVVVTGQDSGVEGLQNIITGQQSMTVFKNVEFEAAAASQLAIALAQGKDPADAGLTLSPFDDPQAPNHDLQAVLLPTQVITQANVQDVIDAGALKAEEVCKGIESDCEKLGTLEILKVAGPVSGPAAIALPQERKVDAVVDPILSSRNLNKSFGPVHVLHDVDFDVYPGEVTALVGDNGAGKSTLVKCFAGINSIDSGELLFEGQPVVIHDPRAATALGIEFVYQDLALADNLDITQNMFLGRESRRLNTFLADGEIEKKARETLASLSVRTVSSVRQLVSNLSGGHRQTVAIAKAVLWNSKVVFLDEPTAALGVAQTRQVLDLVRRLADQGRGVVLISHNMNDVMEVADRVCALFLGRVAAEVPKSETSTTQIVELITSGRSGDRGLAPATVDENA